MSVYRPDQKGTPSKPPSSESATCTWPSCGHTAKGQCRGAAQRIQLYTEDQSESAVSDAIARAERAEIVAEMAITALKKCASGYDISATMAEEALKRIAALKGVTS